MKKKNILLGTLLAVLSVATLAGCKTKTKKTTTTTDPAVVTTTTEQVTIKVTFDLDGAEGSINELSQKVNKGSSATFTLPEVTFNNGKLRFSGWSKSKNGPIEYQNGEEITVSSSIKLYAIWDNYILATYNFDNGFSKGTLVQRYEANDAGATVTIPTLEELTSDSNIALKKFYFISKIVDKDNNTVTFGSSKVYTEDVTFTVVSSSTYLLKFVDPNNESTVKKNVSVAFEEGGNVVLPEESELKTYGYTLPEHKELTGWNISGDILAPGTELTTDEAYSYIDLSTKSMTIKPVFATETVRVHYVAIINGVTTDIVDNSHKFGDTFELMSFDDFILDNEVDLPTNYNFNGWTNGLVVKATDHLFADVEEITLDDNLNYSAHDLYFYASFTGTGKYARISYNAPDGEYYTNVSFSYGSSIYKFGYVPTEHLPANAQFLGWSLTKNSTTPDFLTSDAVRMPSTDFPLYAVYVPDSIGVVEDVFTIDGRGTVVTMTLNHPVWVNEEVDIIDKEGSRISTVIIGIEKSKATVDDAAVGESVGILLRGVERDEVSRYDTLVVKNSCTASDQFAISFRLYTPAEGGRNTPIMNNVQVELVFDDKFTTAATLSLKFPQGVEMVLPGETAAGSASCLDMGVHCVYQNFIIRLGGRTIGRGYITNIS